MLWFLTLTQRCNLNCRYCGNGESFDIEDAPHPVEITFDFEKACGVIAKADPEPVVCFYGGEPLLKPLLLRKAVQIFSSVNPATKFVLQTNGTVLGNTKSEILSSLHAILVSIDGPEEVTDFYRGAGTYAKVLENVRNVRSRGYQGDLIARLTISAKSDIFRDVSHLLDLGLFDHIHWQLDALFDAPMRADFEEWKDSSYNPGITKLAERMRVELKQGSVTPLVPFLGLIRDYLELAPGAQMNSSLRCGSGESSFTLTTAGKIFACPIAPVFDGCTVLESVFEGLDVQKLPHQCTAHIAGPCVGCDIRGICGGRCLVANKTLLWGGDGFDAVCATVRRLVAEVQALMPDVRAALEEGRVRREDLCYPTYNNSTEIIP